VARLLIFDSNATVDAGGNVIKDYSGVPVLGTLNDVSIPSKTFVTQPVRLSGALDGPAPEVLYEFLFDGGPAVAPADWIDLSWWQEFYNDGLARQLPSLRTAAGVNPNFGWPRETVQYGAAPTSPSDLIRTRVEVYEPVRHIVLADGYNYFVQDDNHSFLIACPVSGLYARLAFALGASGPWPVNTYRLRVWAMLGGYDQQDTLNNGTLPYVEL